MPNYYTNVERCLTQWTKMVHSEFGMDKGSPG